MRREPLLEVRDLKMHFPIQEAAGLRRTKTVVQAVDGVSFDAAARAQTLGLVGESGCGKSTTGAADHPAAEPDVGVRSCSRAPTSPQLKERELRPFRRELQIVFQDPYSSLNPRHTVGTILRTPLRVHGLAKRPRGVERVQELLELVGLNPEHHNRYPNEFSGGQRQRIGIARALAVEPEADHRRRAGLGPRRLDPGPGDEPARQDLRKRARPRLRLHRPRPRRRPPLLRPGRGDVPRQDRRAGRPAADLRRAAAPVHPGAAVGGAGHRRRPRRRRRRSGSGSSATCPARSTRRAAAGSAPAAGRRRTSAPPRSRCWRRRTRAAPGHVLACHFPEVRTDLVAEVPA